MTALTKRLEYLREQHRDALLTAFRADPRNRHIDVGVADDVTSADLLFQRYRDADPTRTGACTQWLIRQALAGRLPVEDLPKARETLEGFLAYKRRLPADARDLGRYESLGEIWRSVEPFVMAAAPVSGKDEERREREAVRAESKILLEQDGWTVAIPNTERAACWWGRGTRWCTAGANYNMFAHYSNMAPLVVFVRPDGEKFQFHAGEETDPNKFYEQKHGRDSDDEYTDDDDEYVSPNGVKAQFMDQADNPADVGESLQNFLETIRERLPALYLTMARCEGGWRARQGIGPQRWERPRIGREFGRDFAPETFLEALRDFGLPFHAVPEHARSPECWKAAFDRDVAILQDMPPGVRTVEMLEAALDEDPEILNGMGFTTDERALCAVAIKRFPFALRVVPKPLRDAEMCWDAVRKQGGAIQYVPESMRDAEMCRIAVASDANAIRFIPTPLLEPDMCLSAMQRDGRLLMRIPPALRTEAVCLAAVESFTAGVMTFALHDLVPEIPEPLLTSRMCTAIVTRAPYLLHRLPAEALTRDVCLAAVEVGGTSLKWVPEAIIDHDICLAAVRQDGQALEYVPERLRSRDLCLQAVSGKSTNSGLALEHVPPEHRDAEVCRAAVKNHAFAFEHVPEDVRDRALCMSALLQSPAVIGSLHDSVVDRDMCEFVVRQNWSCFRFVPDRFIDQDLCLLAAQQNTYAIREIPARLQTPEFYAAAVRMNFRALGDIPIQHHTRALYLEAVRSWGWDGVNGIYLPNMENWAPSIKFILAKEKQAASASVPEEAAPAPAPA